jgi:predicted small metal-binding protein
MRNFLDSLQMIIILIVRKGVKNMDKNITCKDLGYDCPFTACAATEPELLEKFQEHGRTAHDLKEFSPEFYSKVQKSIREGSCDLEEDFDSCECCC